MTTGMYGSEGVRFDTETRPRPVEVNYGRLSVVLNFYKITFQGASSPETINLVYSSGVAVFMIFQKIFQSDIPML